MADTPFRNRSIRRLSIAVAIGGPLAGLTLAFVGIVDLAAGGADISGAVLLASGLILTVVSLFLYAGLEISIQAENNVNRICNAVLDLLSANRRIEPLIKTIADNSQISDAAKSIAHRELEREALRLAIREEMVGGDTEAVQYLISEMERRFGYRQEAQDLRQEMAQMREMTIEEKISEAIEHIHKLCSEHRWHRAGQESERLMKLFPRHERVAGLPKLITEKRVARKQELLSEWQKAVQREEIDHGIAILTQLDQYLTPEEAQALQDSARNVFKARLLNLGVQFSLAVTENRWRDALEIGLRIRQEFPNSRMAHEVSQKLDTLRLRAGFVADAEVISSKKDQPVPPPPKN